MPFPIDRDNVLIEIGTVTAHATALPVYLRELEEDCGPVVQVGNDPGDGDVYNSLAEFIDNWGSNFVPSSRA